MESLWSRIRQSLREGLLTAAEKTEELAKVSKGKFDLMAIRRRIAGLLAELGGRVYHLLTVEKTLAIVDDEEVQVLIERVRALERQLKDKEEEIQRIGQGAASSRKPLGS